MRQAGSILLTLSVPSVFAKVEKSGALSLFEDRGHAALLKLLSSPPILLSRLKQFTRRGRERVISVCHFLFGYLSRRSLSSEWLEFDETEHRWVGLV
jgi:hypothetical protein